MKTQFIKRCSLITAMLFIAGSATAEQPSFSMGKATQINTGLKDCGNRSRISAVGEIKSEDGKVWTVPAKTNFLTATKATDLYNECGGEKLNSVTDLDLSNVPAVDTGGNEVFTAYLFPDNYFELYINGVLLSVDSVPFTPFNSSVVRFKADRSFTIAIKMVDWEETLGLGMESNRGTEFHAGDGGLVAHFQDADGKTVALTDNSWKAQTFYTAPIVDRKCLVINGAVRDSSACDQQTVTSFESTSAAHWSIPENWMKTDFDDSAWPAATTFSNDTVGVDNKKSYTNFTNIFDTEGADADFIWSSNLVLDNVVLLRKTVDSSTTLTKIESKPTTSNQKKPKDNKRPPKRPEVKLKVPAPSESIASEACLRIQASVAKSGDKDVTVTCDKNYAYVQSDTYPDHSLMNGITGTNEQLPVPALNYTAPILLNPEIAETKTSIDAALGVAINGVPIYDYSAQGEIDLHGYDANKDTLKLGQLDECGGHAGRGDDYHYHAKPTCMIEAMKNANDSTIIGWGYDGFPLYGDVNPDGSAITKGDLDVCNGQADNKFVYRYHTSVEAPYIIQCLVGKMDMNILPRVAPLSGAEARADLRPPREGVENLKHVIAEDGTRILNYIYKGTEYYTRFKPSKTKVNCYDFEQKTISSNGEVESGTYCR